MVAPRVQPLVGRCGPRKSLAVASISMTDFHGFPQAGLDFLTELGSNDKAWFDAHRKQYDAEVVAPAKAFVVALGEELRASISDGIEAQPKTNGSIAPINNDLRFSPDASPYKDHLMFRFWEGPTKKTSAMLMVRLHPTDGIGFASGMNFASVDDWRVKVAADKTGKVLAAAIDQVVAATGADVVGQGLKKVPKPYDPGHVRGDLLRHKGLQVRFIKETPKGITKPGFVPWCANHLARTADIHHWLVQHLA